MEVGRRQNTLEGTITSGVLYFSSSAIKKLSDHHSFPPQISALRAPLLPHCGHRPCLSPTTSSLTYHPNTLHMPEIYVCWSLVQAYSQGQGNLLRDAVRRGHKSKYT